MRPPLGRAGTYWPIRPRPTDEDSDDPRNMVPLLMPRIPITRPLSLPSSSSVIVAVVPVVVRDDHPNEGEENEDEEIDETMERENVAGFVVVLVKTTPSPRYDEEEDHRVREMTMSRMPQSL